MSGILKFCFLQGFWFLAVKVNYSGQIFLLITSILSVILNFYLFKPLMTKLNYFLSLVSFILFGLFHEFIFGYFKLVDYSKNGFPFWLISLYIVFLCYYGDIFNRFLKMNRKILFLLGGIGGAFSYYSGAKISNLEVMTNFYYFFVFILWGFFFPLSLHFFNWLSFSSHQDQT